MTQPQPILPDQYRENPKLSNNNSKVRNKNPSIGKITNK